MFAVVVLLGYAFRGWAVEVDLNAPVNSYVIPAPTSGITPPPLVGPAAHR